MIFVLYMINDGRIRPSYWRISQHRWKEPETLRIGFLQPITLPIFHLVVRTILIFTDARVRLTGTGSCKLSAILTSVSRGGVPDGNCNSKS